MDLDHGIHSIAIPGDLPEWVQLLPAGTFRGRDGRGPYALSDPAAVVAATRAIDMDLPIDIDHQAEFAPKGTLVPAAAWIKEVEARDDGVWGRVEFTQAAAEKVKAKEYRYLSPVFQFKRGTGEIFRIIRATLTNYPNLALTAIASQGANMKDLLKTLAALFGLPEDADAAAVEAHAQQLVTEAAGHGTHLGGIAKALGLAEGVKPEAIATAAADLRTRGGKPDPAKFVPFDQFEALQTSFNTFRTGVEGEQATAKVEAAMTAGKLAPALKDWALELATADPAKFDTFVASQPVLLAPGGGGGQPPKGGDGLTGEELAACSMLGVSVEDFKKTRAEEEAAA